MRCGGRNSARRGGSAAQYRKRGIHSVPLVEAADHGGCAVSGSRQYCTTHLRRSVKAHAFPRNGTFVMRDIPRIRANGGRIRCRKAHLGYLSDNYTSEKGCLSIPQTQNIPVRGIRGRFSSPQARAGRGGGTPVSGVRTETNVNAQRRTCRTEVWKKCMHQTHPAARKSAFRIINTAHSA